MALKTLKSTMATLAPIMPVLKPRRTVRIRGRALQELRERYLRLHPLCVTCDQVGRVTAATELDHIEPQNHATDYAALVFD